MNRWEHQREGTNTSLQPRSGSYEAVERLSADAYPQHSVVYVQPEVDSRSLPYSAHQQQYPPHQFHDIHYASPSAYSTYPQHESQHSPHPSDSDQYFFQYSQHYHHLPAQPYWSQRDEGHYRSDTYDVSHSDHRHTTWDQGSSHFHYLARDTRSSNWGGAPVASTHQQYQDIYPRYPSQHAESSYVQPRAPPSHVAYSPPAPAGPSPAHGAAPASSSDRASDPAPSHTHLDTSDSSARGADLTVPTRREGSQGTDDLEFDSWEDFQVYWKDLLARAELESLLSTVRGETGSAIASQKDMLSSTPLYTDCEELARGVAYVTVEKLKGIVRGINQLRVPGHHLSVTGRKAELVERVSATLRYAKDARLPSYTAIAKLFGEAQGHHYSTPASSDVSSLSSHYNHPIVGPLSGPSPYGGHANPTASTSGYSGASTSTSTNNTSGSSLYANQSGRYGMNRTSAASTGRPSYGGSSGSSTTTNGYGGGAGPSSSSYSNTSYSQNRYQPYGQTTASSRPGSSTQPSYNTGYPNNYGQLSSTNLSSSIPTSWPTLPPKASAPSSSSSLPAQPIPINFKPSPFYHIQCAVSNIVTLPKALQGERTTVTAPLILSEDQRQKLRAARTSSSAPQYQLRLYCTSIDFYSPTLHQNAYGGLRPTIPIEFPPTCEAKINEYVVPGNLKGIKKKPGTTPPANVSSTTKAGKNGGLATATTPHTDYALNIESESAKNKVDLTYINTEKIYYMIVYFVEYVSTEKLVERVRRRKFRPKEEVVKSLLRQNEDSDIQATSSSLSMKDPLSFMDLTTPVRSVHCPHLQCFDAAIWLGMMETTPTWACPVCNKTLNPDDLVLDGFTQDIMKTLKTIRGGDYDHVIVEVDGTWRTEDNKHGDAKAVSDARAAAELAAAAAAVGDDEDTPPPPSRHAGTNGKNVVFSNDVSKDGTPLDTKPDINTAARTLSKGRSKTPAEVIDLGDDDDDDEDVVPPPRPTASASRSSTTTAAPAAASGRGGTVIDLTLSDDDDDDDEPVIQYPSQRGHHSNASGSSHSASQGNSGISHSHLHPPTKRRADSSWSDHNGGASNRPRYQ